MPKTKTESQPMLLNWPPSRGPMPKWMSAPNRYDIPAVEIERIEGVAPPIKPTKDYLIVSGSWSMSYHVSTVASLTPDQAIVLLKGDAPLPSTLLDPPARTFVLDIDYNHYLSKGVTARATIKPYMLWYPQGKEWSAPRQDVGYLLWQIAGVFKKLWKEHNKCGPWGHDVSDLYFEGIEFKRNVLTMSIGS